MTPHTSKDLRKIQKVLIVKIQIYMYLNNNIYVNVNACFIVLGLMDAGIQEDPHTLGVAFFSSEARL